ncbi:McrB family protein [Neolewinella agarilytica]|nr:AAA family ATPase [Neolewinella agarilytica]
MKEPNLTLVHDNFERFVYDFLFLGNSILTKDKNIATSEAVAEVFECFVKNYIEGAESFEAKQKAQFAGASYNAKLLFAHALWLWSFAVSDISPAKKRSYVEEILDGESFDLLPDLFSGGIGSGGLHHTQKKFEEILFVVKLILYTRKHHQQFQGKERQNTSYNIRDWIADVCLYAIYKVPLVAHEFAHQDVDQIVLNEQLAMSNILMHLAWPNRHERIFSAKHKRDLVATFDSFLTKGYRALDREKQIKCIRGALSQLPGVDEDFDFYTHPVIRQLWYPIKDSDNFYSQEQALQYKGAIILYGPPGTGKTHNAKLLARKLVLQKFFQDKDKIRSYLTEGENEIVNSRIQRRQLHPRYGYEDFIAGIHLKDGNTIAQKGDFLKFCETAVADPDQNYVLILDEINRVDLSQLLGEAFSALENRGETIDLPIGGFLLTVPKNLYVIGTMNEIDFSVENIDFALRRRFHWFFYGFDPDALQNIIEEKDENNHLKGNKDLDRFLRNVAQLNQGITDHPELGKQYQIGHTFFAEIVDIYYRYHELEGKKRKMKTPLFGENGPAKTLWEISIAPIISAFLGNHDSQHREETISHFYTLYLAD